MAAVEMGEVDEIHSKEDNIKDGVSVNGDVSDYKDEMDDENSSDVIHINSDGVVVEDSANESSDDEDNPSVQEEEDADCIIQEPDDPLGEEDEDEEEDDDDDEVLDSMDVQEIIHEDDDEDEEDSNDEEEEIHEIVNSDEEDDNDVRINNSMLNGVDSSVDGTDVNEKSAVVTINDSGEEVVMLDEDNNTDNVEEIDYTKEDTVEGVVDNKKDFIENGRGNDVALTNANGKDIQTVDDDDEDDDDDDDVINLDDDTTNKDDDTANKDDDTANKDDDTTNKDDDITKKDKKATDSEVVPRRSSRNINKRKAKLKQESEKIAKSKRDEILSEESDIEEILPEDPLAVSVPSPDASPSDKLDLTQSNRPSSSTIVVKDTKCLAEIATKSTANSFGNNSKKEPTLVIIDTNSILSGHGPVPITQKPSVSSPISNSFTMLPMALPAQGIYPANMRATITPIPMTTSSQQASKSSASQSLSQPVLPTLTDDMFVVEAPSFIVPYVYEKPPMKDLREFVKNLEIEIEKLKKSGEKDVSGNNNVEVGDKTNEDKQVTVSNKENSNEKVEENTESKTEDKGDKDLPSMSVPSATTLAAELRKPSGTYFDSPLGKFFMGIGYSLVQEAVQTDLLKQQKRRRDREGGQNPETLKTINSLMKNLEQTKENNEPYHMPTKKCEFCSFKTESALAMAYHLETPHMKNYIYRCNFCDYEVRSPHDILFHMEVQHGVRGRLERAPAFHQCPSCPFEDNQKGKLSRHLVACARKFKPERNLEPPADYEPPAKIPRAPRMKQQGLGSAAAMYQAMARNSQYQMMAKVVPNMSALQRSRGRPTLGTNSVKSSGNVRPVSTSGGNMLYKQATMSGGSVLVPTSYQLSGNQLYQQQQLTQSQQQSSANKSKSHQQPSISITPLPRSSANTGVTITKPGDTNSKNSFVICEICDGYIKDLEQLRNHMQWIHKVKIHPKMIYNRPPLNCQKCQFRFFTDQGLERHLLGSHGLVTSSMQEAANKTKDAGRCPVCGRVYQWKLLNHVARDHNMTLKPAHLSYKCTVCTATFGMYKQFENHVYSAHSVVAKRVMDKKSTSTPSGVSSKSESILKPLKINDEITIIPQPAKPACNSGNDGNKEDGIPSTSRNSFSNGNSSTTKGFSSSSELRNELSSGTTLSSRSSRRKPTVQEDN